MCLFLLYQISLYVQYIFCHTSKYNTFGIQDIVNGISNNNCTSEMVVLFHLIICFWYCLVSMLENSFLFGAECIYHTLFSLSNLGIVHSHYSYLEIKHNTRQKQPVAVNNVCQSCTARWKEMINFLHQARVSTSRTNKNVLWL